MAEKKTVILAGATGLIGTQLTDLLAENSGVQKVASLGRRTTATAHAKIDSVVVDFQDLENTELSLTSPVYGICTLGTTQKKAGSKEAFRKVDFDFIVNFGKLCRRMGVEHLHVISSIGADKKSLSFYLKVKGQTEKALKELGIPVLSIYRPSLLLGDRQEHRPAEALGAKLMGPTKFLFAGPFKNYKPIEVRTVAKAIVNRLNVGPESGAGKSGRTALGGVVHVLESSDIEEAARA